MQQIEKVEVLSSSIVAIFPSSFRTPKEYGVVTASGGLKQCTLSILQGGTIQSETGTHDIASFNLAELITKLDSARFAWSPRMTGFITSAVYFFQKGTNRMFAFYISPKGHDGAMAIWLRRDDSWVIEEEYITMPNTLY